VAGPIRISVLANGSQARAELKQVSTTAQKVGAGFRKMALPAVAALGAIGAASFKATQAAADDDAAQARLAQTLKTAAGATKGHVAATEAWISAQGKALGITDDELRPAISKLAVATGSITKAQKLASVAMNISAGSGKSLEQITTALAKAQATGSVTALAKYGVATKDAAGNTKSLSQVTSELAAKYKGAAAKSAGTAAGQQRKLQVQLGELQEEIGLKLLPALAKMAAFGLQAVAWIGDNQGKVTALVAALAALAAGVLVVNGVLKVYTAGQAVATAATAAFSLAQKAATAASLGTRIGMAALAVQTAVTSAATKAYAAAQWLLNAALTANPIGLVVVAIAALVAGFVIAYKKSETFRNIVNKAFSVIKSVVVSVLNFLKGFISGAFNAIKAYFTTAFNIYKTIATTAFTVIKTVVTTYINAVKTVISTVWNTVKSITTTAWNGIKTAVSNGISGVLTFVRNLPGKILSALGSLGSLLYNAGRDIIQGLLDGIASMVDTVKGKLKDLTNLIPDIKGPPSKDKVLLRPAGRSIIQGLVDGFADGEDGVKKSLSALTKRIEKALDKRYDGKALAKHTRAVTKSLKDEYAALTKNGKAQDRLNKKLEDARKTWADIRKQAADYAANIKQSFVSFGSITGLGKQEDGSVVIGNLISELKDRLVQAQRFTSLVNDLAAGGLGQVAIQQLLDAGVEGGLATAEAIASGGAAAIAEINSLQSQIATQGGVLGNVMADKFYGAGIQAAAGVVKGLEKQEKALDKVAERLANTLTKAISKGLKDAMATHAKTPNATSTTAKAATSNYATTSSNSVTVKLTAQQISQLQRGREIQADLDAYKRAGGRVAS
jgi:hypothetical protein